ncbi:malonate decarboxylase beta subunit [Thalassobacillus cyri]|uniref:Malonate decarboxylase beta subunit n=1 Tax=Thalassobacillus cyri TaxID=571932 RepID=A0A1H4AJ82_9BACI|nr:biotin-independent malonate decarboxylase subunit beta [Thalassobacillus cyri]SEA35980.1 malonate decarboxylase beta subunit [Thalassobacillus cyri]
MTINMLKHSLVELDARSRAESILDEGTFRELLDPFAELESPHLEKQGIVPQSDDGVVIAKGRINGESAVVISIEASFQGGGIGEVSGAKIAGALELVLQDNRDNERVYPVLLFDTGGVRLQEANYGLLSIAEIGSAIVALRKYVPVIGLVPGKIGAFGGMSITAGLCTTLLMTREGRIGLNGPEVIEQEAGIEELDSQDRQRIWNAIGGEQRVAAGLAERLVADDSPAIKEAIHNAFEADLHENPRSTQVEQFCHLINSVEPTDDLQPYEVRKRWNSIIEGETFNYDRHRDQAVDAEGRGYTWFKALTGIVSPKSEIPSVLCGDKQIGDSNTRFISVVPDTHSKYPRARNGEVGLEQGWAIASYVHQAIEEDKDGEKRAIVAIVDVPSQAYGYREELLGLHQACAAAVDAYATARMAGHPVVSLIVGNAISGAFLSHGMQSNRVLAFDDEKVNVHVMSKSSAARITRRTVDELEEATKKVPAMAYDIKSFASLGALHDLIDGVNFDDPTRKDVELVREQLNEAILDIKISSRDLSSRLTSMQAVEQGRTASIKVREKLRELW